MQEEYLHYLWRVKRLNFSRLKLANLSKSEVSILNTGWYNTDSGPDFFNGKIFFDNLNWSGNIEIHLKSSDWYRHRHHLDKAYDNVILHVVYEHDKEVKIKNRILPTIELKHQIDQVHLQRYKKFRFSQQPIPCSTGLPHHKFALLQQIDIAFFQRIERKAHELIDETDEFIKPNDLLLRAVFKAVGGKTNTLPMVELSQQLSSTMMDKEKWEPSRIEALLFGCSGLLSPPTDLYSSLLFHQWSLLQSKYKLEPMNRSAWKFKGMRPHSFPTVLLAKLAGLIQQLNFADIEECSANKIIQRINSIDDALINSYWEDHFVFGKLTKQHSLRFSKLFKNNILINGIVPYFVVLKNLKGDYLYLDKAVELMELLPPEKNYITRKWEKIECIPQSAMDSQGMLELYNSYCTAKKCMSCKVGAAILEQKHEKNDSKNSVLL